MIARLVAFHLPQFHAIPENDAWWGEGFTEWTNVRDGVPWFDWHRQPLVPGELGYYDLMDPAVRDAQAALAREHGIGAFCYYHYWFRGRRLLERPVQALLESGKPDFPFCLAWANEPWTRAWDGGERQVLMPQHYDDDDHRAHASYLAKVFADRRYLSVEGRPVFLVYKASKIPDVAGAIRIWRDVWETAEIRQPLLVRMESSEHEKDDPRVWSFDAAVEFQPAWREMRFPDNALVRYAKRFLLGRRIPAAHDYGRLSRRMAALPVPAWPRFPGLTPMWDNTCRRGGRGLVLRDSTPQAYGEWLTSCLRKAAKLPYQDPLVFVNAWNEWGEGCHLEPDAENGRAYLLETRRRLDAWRQDACA